MNIDKYIYTNYSDYTYKNTDIWEVCIDYTTLNGDLKTVKEFMYNSCFLQEEPTIVEVLLMYLYHNVWESNAQRKWYNGVTWTDLNGRYETNHSTDYLYNNPIKRFFPWLGTWNDLEILNSNINSVVGLSLNYYDEEGNIQSKILPKIYEVFDSFKEMEEYLERKANEEWEELKRKPDTYDGALITPNMIDVAREVFEAYGYNETELNNLNVGYGGGWETYDNKDTKYLFDIIARTLNESADKRNASVALCSLNRLREINTVANKNLLSGESYFIFQMNGFVDDEILQERLANKDEDIIPLPDGRIYCIHEVD